MQTKKHDGILPLVDTDGVFLNIGHGLTKREYFASMALQGLLNVPFADESYIDQIPKMAVNLADELIKALNEDETNFK